MGIISFSSKVSLVPNLKKEFSPSLPLDVLGQIYLKISNFTDKMSFHRTCKHVRQYLLGYAQVAERNKLVGLFSKISSRLKEPNDVFQKIISCYFPLETSLSSLSEIEESKDLALFSCAGQLLETEKDPKVWKELAKTDSRFFSFTQALNNFKKIDPSAFENDDRLICSHANNKLKNIYLNLIRKNNIHLAAFLAHEMPDSKISISYFRNCCLALIGVCMIEISNGSPEVYKRVFSFIEKINNPMARMLMLNSLLLNYGSEKNYENLVSTKKNFSSKFNQNFVNEIISKINAELDKCRFGDQEEKSLYLYKYCTALIKVDHSEDAIKFSTRITNPEFRIAIENLVYDDSVNELGSNCNIL